MKNATYQYRPAVLGLIAALTAFGGTVPSSSCAQESTRMMATGSQIPLTAEAPAEYTVKRGDTLWDISKLFLRDPWYWPEIWYVNTQIENPHRIYPGDLLKLVYVDGKPRLTLAQRGEPTTGPSGTRKLQPQVRREALSRAITSVPYEVIAGFAGRPTLLDKSQVRNAPYVVALRDGHLIGGTGNEIYARGIQDAATETRFSVIHVDGELRDPESNDVLGYTGIYVGSGPVVAPGKTAKLVLTDSALEALQGDKLFPETTEINADFVPHAPERDIDATVIGVRSMSVMGQYQVVALNRGSKAGLEPGHVLALQKRGDIIRDKYARGGLDAGQDSFFKRGKKVQLPAERIGVAMIYRTFDRMSYALIMESSQAVHDGDGATNP
jgi:LysM domain